MYKSITTITTPNINFKSIYNIHLEFFLNNNNYNYNNNNYNNNNYNKNSYCLIKIITTIKTFIL
jgi:hypothetical protein